MGQSLSRIQIIVQPDAGFELENRSDKVDYFVLDDPELVKKLNVDGVLLLNPNSNISEIRKNYPDMLIGGIANDIVDCKNWELAGVDFIQFRINALRNQRKLILGSELLNDIIPKKTEYGWVILSLNIPVFITGVASFAELSDLYREIDFYGVDLTSQYENKLSLTEQIARIEELFR